MRIWTIVAQFCLIKNIAMAVVICSPEPIASCSPLQSILHTWPRRDFEYVGNRLRLSTCTGVIWVGDQQLISIGFHNHSIDTYHFDPTIPNLFAYKSEDLQAFQKSKLGKLENIALSQDGAMIAVTNNGSIAVHLYKITDSEMIHRAEIPKVGFWTHGVEFSRHMDYLAYTLFGDPGKIMLYRLTRNEDEINVTLSQMMDANVFPLHPKGIDFSLDDRFVAVCFAINNSNVPKRISGSLAVYSFDRVHGLIDPHPVSVIGTSELLSVPEDVCFSPEGTSLWVANHGNDTVTTHAFDPATGQLGESRILLQNPEAKLSFPHGLSISPDGKYLAVANYGDDTVKIYAITE
jgi:DNA-binding beta-propeller fold protein YncE